MSVIDHPGEVNVRLDALRAALRALDSVVVAFSGGVDSALVAYVAHDTLGPERARSVTAVSPSLAGTERAECEALATEWGLSWSAVESAEMDNAAYRRNDANRCYWCKDALMDALKPVAGDATVVLGVNLDDLGEHRPGQHAAAQQGARFPLVEAGFTKADVRAVSAALGLRTADKPAAACLASRLPYGTEVSLGVLSRVERAEAALRAMGFASLRVRHYDDTARIEVPIEQLGVVVERHDDVSAAVHRAGYRYVTLDLDGLRSGNLNDALG